MSSDNKSKSSEAVATEMNHNGNTIAARAFIELNYVDKRSDILVITPDASNGDGNHNSSVGEILCQNDYTAVDAL